MTDIHAAGWPGVRGKRVVITGATRGIGLAAAVELARLGAQLAIVARDDARGRDAVARIRARSASSEVDVLHADLTSQASVRELAAEVLERYPRLEVLVNNAGAMFSTRQVSVDGIELTWALNHLAPFLLTNLLLDRMIASAPARIVTTASDAHKGRLIPFDDLDAEHSYKGRGFARYGETKLANILFTLELGRRLQGTGVTANCFHPGLVATGFNRNNGPLMNAAMLIIKPFARSPKQGADTLVWLVDSPDAGNQTGGYFEGRQRSMPSRPAMDVGLAARLWEISQEQILAPAAT
jgi:NAD(P)-dependent dehydrogenase (short-subunit alcohol dehydrogenase family)